MNNDVTRIKEKIHFIDFIRSYITLIPAGRNFKALCPFHGERTPSFVVSPERQLWHCFGACGEGGDLIKFVMKYENLDFPEALRYLADRAGIALERDARVRSDLDVIYELHEEARDFYRKAFLECAEARNYLAERGLVQATIDEFEIGYAPHGDAVMRHFVKRGFSINDILRSGLVLRHSSGLYYDKFQERVIFPIHNSVSRVIAFTGRLLPSVQQAREARSQVGELPKYLNSSESPIFNKSKVLYGFHKTKAAIARSHGVFLVEGQMDLVLSYQAGAVNVVAASGTGFTEDHAKLLRRIADSIIVSFDSDRAGFEALLRSLPLFLKHDFHVMALELQEFKDPADMVRASPQLFKDSLDQARPVFEYIIQKELQNIGRVSLLDRRRIIRSLLSRLVLLRSSVERDEYLNLIARHAGVSLQSLHSELVQLVSSTHVQSSVPRQERATPLKQNQEHERIDVLAERALMLAFSHNDLLAIMRSHANLLPERYRSFLVDSSDNENIALLRLKAETFSSSDDVSLRKEFNELLLRLKIEEERVRMLDLQQKMRFSDGAWREFQEANTRLRVLEEELDSLPRF